MKGTRMDDMLDRYGEVVKKTHSNNSLFTLFELSIE